MRLGTLLNFIVMPLICGTTWASPIIVNIVNPNFDASGIPCGGYAYQGTDLRGCSAKTQAEAPFPQQTFNDTTPGWTFSGGSGLTGPNTAFNPPTFSNELFTQAAFLQGPESSVLQLLTGPAGTWNLSFYLGFRNNAFTDGKQTVEVRLDGLTVGTYSFLGSTDFTQKTVSFEASANPHKLQFLGTESGDHTAFISGVSVSSSVPEPASFVLIGAGLVGLGLLRRSKRRA